MFERDSMNFDEGELSIQATPLQSVKQIKGSPHLFSSTNPELVSTLNKSINVLGLNRINDRKFVNEDFVSYLAEDDENPDTIIVSVMGSKKNGKSFLVDSLLSHEAGKISRLMCKNPALLTNSPAQIITNTAGERVIFLDNNGETASDVFLWNYFLSSIIIYNMSTSNSNEEQNLFDNLYHVQTHLESDLDSLSVPQLIIVRRDVQSSHHVNDRDLLKRIEQYGIFHPEILTVHLPYPGSQGVKSKQILDVPLKCLSDSYLCEVRRLMQTIKAGKPKVIKGNYLSTKVLSLALEPLTKSINKDHRISTNQVWDEIVETLSVGFYNFYLKSYSEQLQREFQSEQPADRYTVHKKLGKIKRKTDKKVQVFKNIENDPIFMRYRAKLEETIKSKEDLVKEVNRTKSINANQQYCEKLMGNLNEKNYEELIDQYCKSGLDDHKTEVLLDNFQQFVAAKSKQTSSNGKPEEEIERLEQELRDIEAQIENQKKTRQSIKGYSFEDKKKEIAAKQEQLKQLQAEYEKVRGQSEIMPADDNEKERFLELEKDCNQLKDQIKDTDKEIENIRMRREDALKQTTLKLEQQLKQEDEKLKKLEKMLRDAQGNKSTVKKAQGGKKDTCCCMIM